MRRTYMGMIFGLCFLLALFGCPNPDDDNTDDNDDDHGGTRATATRVAPNSSTPGTLEVGGDLDMFRLDLPAGGTLTVRTTGGLDTVGTLLDAAGEQLATDDDSGTDRNFELSRSLPAGTYYVEVAGFSGSTTWPYTFEATFDDTGQAPVDCPGQEVVGTLTAAPTIEILDLQPGDSQVQGQANNIDARRARVVLYAKTDQWYVQPFTNTPFTTICSDGSWENSTHPWNRLVALLVDDTYVPNNTRTEHPASAAGVLAWDEFPARSVDRTVAFSGHTWTVKTGVLAGPGPNYFSDSADNVWVDAEGLHLRIIQQDGRWYTSEVFLPASLGYGVYSFTVARRLDALDYHAVFAGFVYESANREIDIEFSRVLADPQNAQYVVQPFTRPGNILRFIMPAEPITSHRFEWRADRIVFTSWRGMADPPAPADIIFSRLYTGPDIPPPGGERMRFNLWLFGGRAPLSAQGDEVVIQSFRYNP